jgi:serine/threonine protein kinase
MTSGSDPNLRDTVRAALQSQHPRLADEIQGAINTLRKLQEIAGAPAAGPPPVADADEQSVIATADGAPAAPHARATADYPTAKPAIAATTAPRITVTSDQPATEPTTPVLAAGESFGRYQIVRLLGRGAMGAVYLAYDAQLERHVALKTPFLGGNPQTLDRFYREARAAAQLRSPYLCPMYDVGELGGVPYLTMAFIEGKPLSRVLDERQLAGEPAIAVLVQKIARGMHKAHEQGIIHRDLKPDNIMVDGDGEPIVMDFGLARRVDEDVRLTLPGRILGTPAYMSPEQVEGNPAKLGPATDIYSLGVILYEMLTGCLPFEGSFTKVLRQITSEPPLRPSAVNAALGEASVLESVCLRLMAKSPADRYASMADVATALEAAVRREQAPAALPPLWKRLASWFGRLWASRPAVPAAARASSGSCPDRTLPDSREASPAEKQAGKSAEQTVDVPQSQEAAKAPPSVEQTVDVPQSQELPKRVPSVEQTVDVPQSQELSQEAPTAEQTVDLPQS